MYKICTRYSIGMQNAFYNQSVKNFNQFCTYASFGKNKYPKGLDQYKLIPMLNSYYSLSFNPFIQKQKFYFATTTNLNLKLHQDEVRLNNYC